jgi:hypothetical protein
MSLATSARGTMFRLIVGLSAVRVCEIVTAKEN